MLETWPTWAIPDDDLIWRRFAGAAGLMPNWWRRQSDHPGGQGRRDL